jgi:hypothetical protein
VSAILIRDDAQLGVTLHPDAETLKVRALETAALVGRVTDATEQETAVNAQRELRRVLKLCEDARKEIKEPVLTYGRKIDSLAKEFSEELRDEELRIAKLTADFQAVEAQRLRAAEALRLADLERLERERQEQLAGAKTVEEIDAVNDAHCRAVSDVPVPVAARAEGQTVRWDWEIVVTDIWSLARSHPMCVKIEPRLLEIKSLLESGVKVAGITARKTPRSGVTMTRERIAIEA